MFAKKKHSIYFPPYLYDFHPLFSPLPCYNGIICVILIKYYQHIPSCPPSCRSRMDFFLSLFLQREVDSSRLDYVKPLQAGPRLNYALVLHGTSVLRLRCTSCGAKMMCQALIALFIRLRKSIRLKN